MTSVKCPNCVFSELIVNEGDVFSILNPHGEDVNRNHERTVYICRLSPPIAGTWPEVGPDDWCGQFNQEESTDEL